MRVWVGAMVIRWQGVGGVGFLFDVVHRREGGFEVGPLFLQISLRLGEALRGSWSALALRFGWAS